MGSSTSIMEIDDTETTHANYEPGSSLSKKGAIAEEPENSSTIIESTSGCLISDNSHGSNSDMSHQGDDDDEVDNEDYISDYDDYMFENNDDGEDYLAMQAHFDNMNLPPGVEASVSWWKDATSSKNGDAVPPSVSVSETDTSVSVVPELTNSTNNTAASSSSAYPATLSSDGKEEPETESDVMKNYQSFKRFDIVDDFSDHHYINTNFQVQQPPKGWTKKIHDEWKILEKNLPDTIYVRVYETRMDLLRAVIIGPSGTPYHDGLFVFDILFPSRYPDIPPMVYYYSGGLRLNPNLCDCGKVCLSLLNTWNGDGNERWMPMSSTMLQVLVSIQALILNAKPFFNEPGYDHSYPGDVGEKKSKNYNENTFILSLKTMMYTLRRPPKHYEDFVAVHFRTRARNILLACRAYVEGAEVGFVVNGKIEDDGKAKTGSREFRTTVSKMMNGLASNFAKNGSKDCEEFRIPG